MWLMSRVILRLAVALFAGSTFVTFHSVVQRIQTAPRPYPWADQQSSAPRHTSESPPLSAQVSLRSVEYQHRSRVSADAAGAASSLETWRESGRYVPGRVHTSHDRPISHPTPLRI
jgi:hypothetical protein